VGSRVLKGLDPDVRAVLAKGFPSLAVKVVGVAAGLGGSVLLGRTIGAEGLGVVMLALTIVQVAAIPARLGLDQVAMRFVATYRDCGDLEALDRLLAGVTLATLAAGGAATLVLLFASRPLSVVVFDLPALRQPLQIMALAIVPLATGIVLNHALRAMGHPVKAAFLHEAAASVLRFAVFAVLILTLGGFDILQAAIVFAAGLVVAGVATVVSVRRLDVKRLLEVDAARIRALVRRGLPFIGMASMLFLISATDVLMLGWLSDADEVGRYSVAARAASVISFLIAAANMVIAPRLAVLYGRGDLPALESFARSTSGLLALAAASLAIGLAVLAPWLLGLWGTEFLAGAASLRILCVANFFNVATGSVASMLTMTGRERLVLYITTLCGVLNIALNWALITRFGATGAALATAAALIVSNLLYVAAVRRSLGVAPLPVMPRAQDRTRPG
jgi:O-antigen/teichoic acid export membrane protein